MTAVTLEGHPRSGTEGVVADRGWHRLAVAAVALALVFAVGIRLRAFASVDGLYHDDTLLATNVVQLGESELLKPLAFDQAAPVGHLLLLKETTRLFGTGDRAFRLPSLAESLAAVFLFAVLLAKLVPPSGQAVGMVLMASAWPLVFYSVSIKQYTGECLASVAILVAGLRGLSGAGGVGRFAPLALVGLVSIFFSMPSVFMLAGVGSTLIVASALNRDYRGALVWAAVAAGWLAAFGGLYLAIYRAYSENSALNSFWLNSFAPFPPRSVDQIKWYSDVFFSLFATPLGLKFTGLAGALALIGAWDFARRGRGATLAMLVAPLAVTLAASALKRYPFGDRMLVFAFPIVATLVAAGASALLSVPRPAGRPVAVALLAVLLLMPSFMVLKLLKSGPPLYHDVKPALAYLSGHYRDGDAVFLDCHAVSMTNYYRDVLNNRDLLRLPVIRGRFAGEGVSLADQLVFYDEQLAPLHGRTWFVFAMDHDSREPLYRYLLGRKGKLVDAFQSPYSSALLYDLGPPEAGAANPAPGPTPPPAEGGSVRG